MIVQSRIPPALAGVHNFIRTHDVDEIHEFEEAFDPTPGLYGELAEGPARRAEIARATTHRDQIASAMWRDYQNITGGMGEE